MTQERDFTKTRNIFRKLESLILLYSSKKVHINGLDFCQTTLSHTKSFLIFRGFFGKVSGTPDPPKRF